MTYLQGAPEGWKLEKEEFIALITTATAGMWGFAYIVAKYLFGSKGYESKTASSDSVAGDAE